MKRLFNQVFVGITCLLYLLGRLISLQHTAPTAVVIVQSTTHAPSPQRILVQTFLGNEKRKFYGEGPVPQSLSILWKVKIGGDSTRINRKTTARWDGTGWTGQPTLVRDGQTDYIIIGGYDHNLRKINAATGEVIWKYQFDDVIKATATLIQTDSDIIITQGSRLGFHSALTDKIIPSYRAISFNTGKELWRFNSPLTASYSRDVDGSGILYNDKLVIGTENGMLYVLDPFTTETRLEITQPKILKSYRLYEPRDAVAHRGNVVVESSTAMLGDVAYISSGAGHIYGINLKNDSTVFDFKTGSDIDGSVTITDDGKLLCGIEKQYIKGNGGLLKLDPSKPKGQQVIWFFPTKDKKFFMWEGGIIGSQCVNEYRKNSAEHMAAFHAIDGNLYVVSLNEIDGTALGFDSVSVFPKPKLLYKKYIGGSISTPLFVDDCILSQGYGGMMYIIRVNYDKHTFTLVDSLNIGSIESTPIVWHKNIFVGCRNGYFYCLGERLIGTTIPQIALTPPKHRQPISTME